jgi:hypothetical protein
MMIVVYTNQKISPGKKSIFLAGPTPRKKEVPSWRLKAIKILKEKDFDGVVYIPENPSGGTFDNLIKRSLWERKALAAATVILFWIPRQFPDLPAFTTNVEFGYWLHTKKIIYGRPDNAKKIKYLDWLYQHDYNKKPFNNLNDLITEAIKMANRK